MRADDVARVRANMRSAAEPKRRSRWGRIFAWIVLTPVLLFVGLVVVAIATTTPEDGARWEAERQEREAREAREVADATPTPQATSREAETAPADASRPVQESLARQQARARLGRGATPPGTHSMDHWASRYTALYCSWPSAMKEARALIRADRQELLPQIGCGPIPGGTIVQYVERIGGDLKVIWDQGDAVEMVWVSDSDFSYEAAWELQDACHGPENVTITSVLDCYDRVLEAHKRP